MGCCVAEEYGSWCADIADGLLVKHEENDYCIFHAPMECIEKLAHWDNKVVYDQIRVQGSGGLCALTGCLFPQAISFSEFGIDNPLPTIGFSRTTFSGNVDFVETVFGGNADFTKAAFDGNTDFTKAAFDGNADFTKATFKGDLCFENVSFGSNAIFPGATFRGDTFFMGINFVKGGIFKGAKFQEIAIFVSANFNYCDFSYTQFGKRVFIRNVFFKDGIFDCCLASDTVQFDRCDLRGLSLCGAPIEDCRFISCQWPRADGRDVVYDSRSAKYKEEIAGYFYLTNLERENHEEGVPLKDHEESPSFFYLEDLFRRLKKVAKAEHDEILASDWHYNEKEMLRLRLKRECSIKNFNFERVWFGSLFLFFALSMYKMISGYGEYPLRALIFFFVLFILPLPLLTPQLLTVFPGGALHYIPLTNTQTSAEISLPTGLWMTFWKLILTVQATLVGFALRNKLRR